MNQTTIRLVNYYGYLRPFIDYKVIKHGFDYVLVKAQGNAVYVPYHMISHHLNDVEVREEIEEPEIEERKGRRYD
jgi:hypothetical protein